MIDRVCVVASIEPEPSSSPTVAGRARGLVAREPGRHGSRCRRHLRAARSESDGAAQPCSPQARDRRTRRSRSLRAEAAHATIEKAAVIEAQTALETAARAASDDSGGLQAVEIEIAALDRDVHQMRPRPPRGAKGRLERLRTRARAIRREDAERPRPDRESIEDELAGIVSSPRRARELDQRADERMSAARTREVRAQETEAPARCA